GRDYPQVNLSSLTPNAQGDGDGHGTFVAGIAADGQNNYTGASPSPHILPIRVMDDNGTARTSDVIAAAQWILANKDTYNIKVANFSLHSSTATHFFFDPLDRAVEKLWFNGIVVVAAAGNYGTFGAPSGVVYSPGNDPFVLTVGAVDIGGTVGVADDTAAPWSAYGLTEDGFRKPELGAPGRYMVGPVSNGTLKQMRLDHLVAPTYMELSGTSFAAPVVAGAAARILALHPDWSPDQVKGALMVAAKPAPGISNWEIGVGELRAAKAAAEVSPPNPNAGLDQFVGADPVTGLSFDAPSWVNTVTSDASWSDASWSDASWSDASWSDASWSDASWSDASWSDASWSDASWSDASWSDASWSDASWSDASWADVAANEALAPVPTLDIAALGEIQADPELALPPASDTIAELGITLHPSPQLVLPCRKRPPPPGAASRLRPGGALRGDPLHFLPSWRGGSSSSSCSCSRSRSSTCTSWSGGRSRPSPSRAAAPPARPAGTAARLAGGGAPRHAPGAPARVEALCACRRAPDAEPSRTVESTDEQRADPAPQRRRRHRHRLSRRVLDLLRRDRRLLQAAALDSPGDPAGADRDGHRRAQRAARPGRGVHLRDLLGARDDGRRRHQALPLVARLLQQS
ncbi:MAG: S8 family serine peptidase, partial [Gaiellaceae bacterium]